MTWSISIDPGSSARGMSLALGLRAQKPVRLKSRPDGSGGKGLFVSGWADRSGRWLPRSLLAPLGSPPVV